MMEKNTEWEMSRCSCFQTRNSRRSRFGRTDAVPDCHEELARRTPQVPPIPAPVSRGLTGLLLKDKQGITAVVRVQIPMERDQMLMHKGSQAAASRNRPRFVLGLEAGLVKCGQAGGSAPEFRFRMHREEPPRDGRGLRSREGAQGLKAEDKSLPSKPERRRCR